MAKIQSMSGLDSNSVKITYDDGETKEYIKCPFPQCKDLHATSVAICPTTKMRIGEEITRMLKMSKQQEAADRAQAKYNREHLWGWKNAWRSNLALGGIIIIALVALFSDLEFLGSFGAVLCVAAMGAWFFFWMRKEKKHKESLKAESKALYQRVLNGEA